MAAAEEERRFRELDDDIARIEASLVSIGAKFRGDNYDQKQWSRDDATKASPVSSETDGPKVVWSEGRGVSLTGWRDRFRAVCVVIWAFAGSVWGVASSLARAVPPLIWF